MNPRFGKRSWVKLWVNEWLDGTTRYQMSGAQRAFWVDLLALAGRSRYDGIICAGKDGDSFVGYPLKTFSALDAGAEIDLNVTFALFQATGKISVEVTSELPVSLFKITICNWEKYQSEYRRQKKYRTKKLQKSDRDSYNEGNAVETEADTDTEVEVKKRRYTAAATAAFNAIGCEPFGSHKFRELWIAEVAKHDGIQPWADAMERVIKLCQESRTPVPGRFFAHKREIEKVEARENYRRTPL